MRAEVRVSVDALEQALSEEPPVTNRGGLRNEALLVEMEEAVTAFEQSRKLTLNKQDRAAMVARFYNHFSGSLNGAG